LRALLAVSQPAPADKANMNSARIKKGRARQIASPLLDHVHLRRRKKRVFFLGSRGILCPGDICLRHDQHRQHVPTEQAKQQAQARTPKAPELFAFIHGNHLWV
jgi:hypothetical protein